MKITKKQRFEILKRDGFRCRYCGRRAPHVELHIDHVDAKANGGADANSNLVAACVDCNVGKGRADLDDRPSSIPDLRDPIEVGPGLIKLPEVMRRVARSRASIYRAIASGAFPKPVLVGTRAVAWVEGEIDEFIRLQIVERDSRGASGS